MSNEITAAIIGAIATIFAALIGAYAALRAASKPAGGATTVPLPPPPRQRKWRLLAGICGGITLVLAGVSITLLSQGLIPNYAVTLTANTPPPSKSSAIATITALASTGLTTPTVPILSPTEIIGIPPYPACLLIGDWEMNIPDNANQLHVVWNNTDNQFEGKITKLGDVARGVGFKVGELTYVAKLTEDPDILTDQGEYGDRGGGRSWSSNTVKFSSWPAADNGIFYNKISFTRLNQSRVPSCHR